MLAAWTEEVSSIIQLVAHMSFGASRNSKMASGKQVLLHTPPVFALKMFLTKEGD